MIMLKKFSVFVLCFTLLPLSKNGAAEVKIVPVQVFASSENAGFEAYRAMDGDATTMWHTQFNVSSQILLAPHPVPCGYIYACGYDHPNAMIPASPGFMPLPAGTEPLPWFSEMNRVKALDVERAELFGIVQKPGNGVPPPHALGIDLGGIYLLTGFSYTPRNDGSTYGNYGKYELYVAKDVENGKAVFGKSIASGEFSGTETTYAIDFGKAVEARYVKFVAITPLDGRPFISIAEFQPIAEGYKFIAIDNRPMQPGARIIDRMPNTTNDSALQERIDEWNLLAEHFKTPLYWKAIKDEVAHPASLILPEDNDPLDVLIRRVSTMLAHLGESMGDRFRTLKDIPVEDTAERFAAFRRVCDLRREIMLKSASSPLRTNGAATEYLFVKRHRACVPHMCDQFYGTNQRPGGGLFVLNVETGEVRNLLENSIVESGRLKGQKLDKGSFLSPDVSFCGTKIAFAYVECVEPEFPINLHNMTHDITRLTHVYTLDVSRGHWDIGRAYHIFTCNADGSELRQITDGTWNDFDPCWLPNGRIAFITERRGGYLRCGRECPTYTLFDMNPDGTQIRPLSFHETHEWNPSVTNDGMILYTRWDYVDRQACIAHHPWTTTPDGRNPREVHGNFSHRHRRPDCEFDCRAIPNSHKFIATAAPHHGQSFGSIIMIDPRAEDDDAMGPVKRLTPDVGFPESQEHWGAQVYGTPWALCETYFLAVADFSYQPGAGILGARSGPGGRGNDGIYLCDIFGNRELLYRDADIASISPMPLAARPMPPVIASAHAISTIEHTPYLGLRRGGRIYHREADGDVTLSQHSQLTGTLSLINVYDSLRPFPENTKITELRIIQLLPMSVPSGYRPHEIGIREGSSLESVNLARWVLGTVPVEEDGSAHFEAPAQTVLLFQAIDEDGLAVQSMRSATYLQPGESLSCIGCHEKKGSASPMLQPRAMLRGPSKIKPETVPGAYPFSYPLLVQPVLDRHCVECHAKPESDTFSLAREPIGENKFYASYNNLTPKYGFTNYGDPLRTIPGRYGAHAAPLYRILKAGHNNVKLSAEEMRRIVLWLDCLSNFYGVYEQEGGEVQLQGKLAWPTLE